jgi:vacuolar-type H+-ATPase subunit I/STV1
MNDDVLSYSNIRVNNDLLDEIWTFDPRKLDSVDGSTLSSYAMALAQYLIYFTYQRNLVKAEQHKLSKYIDRSISLIMTDDDSYVKKYKNKSTASEFIISTNESLMEAQSKLDALQIELIQIEGMDKAVSELIATIKRELTRRENELYQLRVERKN